MADKEVWKEFFFSKGFASIVMILVTQFGSAELAHLVGQGVDFAQTLAASGIIGGIGLALASRWGSAKTKVVVKELPSILAEKDAEIETQKQLKSTAREAARDATERLKKVQVEAERLKPRRVNGKFAKKE